MPALSFRTVKAGFAARIFAFGSIWTTGSFFRRGLDGRIWDEPSIRQPTGFQKASVFAKGTFTRASSTT